jgi:hypothetical protein
MKGAKEGTVVVGGQVEGNSLSQLSCPNGVIVDHSFMFIWLTIIIIK